MGGEPGAEAQDEGSGHEASTGSVRSHGKLNRLWPRTAKIIPMIPRKCQANYEKAVLFS
jgi:hypothetical protein